MDLEGASSTGIRTARVPRALTRPAMARRGTFRSTMRRSRPKRRSPPPSRASHPTAGPGPVEARVPVGAGAALTGVVTVVPPVAPVAGATVAAVTGGLVVVVVAAGAAPVVVVAEGADSPANRMLPTALSFASSP
jgi:hypothetical protein